MASELSEEHNPLPHKDPLSLLSHSWTVLAQDEYDALFKAMERASMIPEYRWRELVRVRRIDYTLFLVENKEADTSIVARVSELPDDPDPVRMIVGVAPSSPLRRFVVTFYPRTYGSGRNL